MQSTERFMGVCSISRLVLQPNRPLAGAEGYAPAAVVGERPQIRISIPMVCFVLNKDPLIRGFGSKSDPDSPRHTRSPRQGLDAGVEQEAFDQVGITDLDALDEVCLGAGYFPRPNSELTTVSPPGKKGQLQTLQSRVLVIYRGPGKNRSVLSVPLKERPFNLEQKRS